MAVTGKGFTDSITNEAEWAKLMSIMARGCWDETVDNGFTPAAATGTRLVSVAAGDAVAAGILINNSGSANVTLTANTSGFSRYDIVVATINWSADTVTLAAVPGTGATNPVDPTLTRTAGTTWHMPIARVLVRNGVTQIAAADVFDIRPLRRRSFVYDPAVSGVTIGPNAAARTICTRLIPDPGWQYRLRLSANLECTQIANGHGIVALLVDGVEVAVSRTGKGNDSPAVISRATGVYTGPHTVTMTMAPNNLTSPDQLTSETGSSWLNIEVEPV